MEAGLAAYQQRRFVRAAEIWLELAGEGHTEAQFNLGVLYKEGIGVPQDHAKSMEWLKMADNAGHHNAGLILSVMEEATKNEV